MGCLSFFLALTGLLPADLPPRRIATAIFVHYTLRNSGMQNTPSWPRKVKTNFRHAEHGGDWH